jgi:iron complex transport system ATP-binding protein
VSGGAIIACEGVRFAYAPNADEVLRGVSASFGAQVTAVLGPNGAGKSTLLRVLGGLRRASAGAVMISGRAVGSLDAAERAAMIAYMPQNPLFSAPFTVREVVSMARGGRRDERAACEAALNVCGLASSAGRLAMELSAGQQQRVALARAVAQLWTGSGEGWGETRAVGAPGRVLLADEPFSALDPAHQRTTAGVLCELASSGVAVAAVMHDAGLAARIAGRALLLASGGTVAGEGPAAELLTADRLAELYGSPFVEASIGPSRDAGGQAGRTSRTTAFPVPDLGPAASMPIASSGRSGAGEGPGRGKDA